MFRRILLISAIAIFTPVLVNAADFNQDIQNMIQLADSSDAKSLLPTRASPTQYSVKGNESVDAANAAFEIKGDQLLTHFSQVKVGMCSTASVMVFLSEISALQAQKKIHLLPATLQELKLKGNDGVGFWGRWNADGPGTAMLFQEYHLGRNFQDIKNAKPGDFLKIFWNDRMGEVPGLPKDPRNEQGHSVVFAGSEKIKGEIFVRFWSANSTNTKDFPEAIGFKMKYKKISDIQHMIFSRLEHLENLDRLTQEPPPRTNAFLSGLLSKSYSYAEGVKASGLRFSD